MVWLEEDNNDKPGASRSCHTQVVELPRPINAKTGAAVHPRDDQTAFVVLSDGSLVLVHCPPFNPHSNASSDNDEESAAKMLYMVRSGGHRSANTLDNKKTHVNCVTLNPSNGRYAYAVCANGLLLCFKLWTPKTIKHPELPPYRATLLLEVPTSIASQNLSDDGEARIPRKDHATGDSADIPIQTHEIVSSRHGDMMVINCFASGQLKLYDTKMLEEAMVKAAGTRASERNNVGNASSAVKSKNHLHHSVQTLEVKPRFVFSDPVDGSRMAFVSCDFSGDGEHLIGACNSTPQPGDKYKLYVWNTSTGTMLDRLTGPQTILNSVCFHPVKAFISAGTFDGIVDVWGPRLDWAAFAPDFQALPYNVEYVEREDEFDTVVPSTRDDSEATGGEESWTADNAMATKQAEEEVDVVQVDNIPVFDSDSEDEEDVFYFQTKLRGAVGLRGRITTSHGK
jgi:WD40 repeat protein